MSVNLTNFIKKNMMLDQLFYVLEYKKDKYKFLRFFNILIKSPSFSLCFFGMIFWFGYFIFEIESIIKYMCLSTIITYILYAITNHHFNSFVSSDRKLKKEEKEFLEEWMKNKKIDNPKEFLILLVDELEDKVLIDNLEKILCDFKKLNLQRETILKIIFNKIDFEKNKEELFNSIYIEEILSLKINGKINNLFKYEDILKKLKKDQKYYKFKYKIIKNDIDTYVNEKDHSYIDNVIAFLEETDMDKENLFILKKIRKEEKNDFNLIDEINNREIIKNF